MIGGCFVKDAFESRVAGLNFRKEWLDQSKASIDFYALWDEGTIKKLYKISKAC
jgi:hypothetical protein